MLVAFASAAATDELPVLVPLAMGLQVTPEGDASALWRRIVDRFEEIKLEGLSAIVLLDDLDGAAAEVLSLVERLLAIGGTALTVVATAGVRAD